MFNVLYSKLVRGLVMFALLLTFVLFAFQSSAEAGWYPGKRIVGGARHFAGARFEGVQRRHQRRQERRENRGGFFGGFFGGGCANGSCGGY